MSRTKVPIAHMLDTSNGYYSERVDIYFSPGGK